MGRRKDRKAASANMQKNIGIMDMVTPTNLHTANSGARRFEERGSTGLDFRLGRVFEEPLRELQGSHRLIETLKEMTTNEPMLAAADLVMRLLIRQVIWSVKPAGPSPQEAEDAEFLQENMHDMEHTWGDFIDDIISMLIFGWSYFEKVYKVRRGPQAKDGKFRSNFSDGKIGWRKFGFRAQETLERWIFDPTNGDILGMVQQLPHNLELIPIPMVKALLFRTSKRKNNPEGKSTYRGAYVPYRLKKGVQILEAIGIERDLVGVPKFEAPERIFGKNATPDEKSLLEILKRIATQIKRDEQEGLVVPQGYDKDGNKKYSYELMSTGGKRQFEIDKTISRYNMEMLITVLADFLLIGHEKVGSFSLSSNKTNLFTVALGTYLTMIKEVLNSRQGVQELFILNGMRRDKYPTIETGDIEHLSIFEVVEAVSKLMVGGFPLESVDEITNQILTRLGLPVN